MTTLYLGTHHPTERFWSLGVPLCVSRRAMPKQKIHRSKAPWILDSGAFTELHLNGRFTFTPEQYAADVLRWTEIGRLAWAAPMDWMCEPFMVERTRLTVKRHLHLTVENYAILRELLGVLVVPVVQGYAPRDYDRCIALYQRYGVELDRLPVVGLGSVCRRSRTTEIVRLIRYLSDYRIRFHGFGIKGDSFRALRGLLTSADSMAWSYAARKAGRDANSPQEAMAWRERQLAV